ncbi:viral A-type inclusion protein [Reticulomyxa filosa]|uniref:Viral A-type inclusion protein n=1 Tax=Reticulomyxa filosa TaxID=46433 RepID=X6MLX6_RETFI|nr:viral A-type inclusion protein [Reticulomyxa filosa]|eukprot:ETO15013.1 viral A-type inclusion protein [Reticulomyxa filosa]
MDESQTAFTRSVVNVSRLKEELSELKQKNSLLQQKLAEFEAPFGSHPSNDQEEDSQAKQVKKHIRSMTRQQIEEEIERYIANNSEMQQEINNYQVDMEWYRVQLADSTQNLVQREHTLGEKEQEMYNLRRQSMQATESLSQMLAIDSENVELKKTIQQLEHKLNFISQGTPEAKGNVDFKKKSPSANDYEEDNYNNDNDVDNIKALNAKLKRLEEENQDLQEQVEFQSKEIEKWIKWKRKLPF